MILREIASTEQILKVRITEIVLYFSKVLEKAIN